MRKGQYEYCQSMEDSAKGDTVRLTQVRVMESPRGNVFGGEDRRILQVDSFRQV